MRNFLFYHLLAACALVSLASCSHDEPVNPIKSVDERTVLVLSHSGDVLDQYGDTVTHLPYCVFAAEIISDGDDYFVSGNHSKGRVGYWKNGKWNTLHVDFIDDVDHWTYGIGKWDYYIYLLDVPNVLKNSGIFPLENFHDFIPATHALAVSEGKCYVIGHGFGDDDDADGHYLPVLYTNYKKEFLPIPGAAITGECHAIYAYDRDHTIIGGIIGGLPAVWVDKEYEIYPVSYPRELKEGEYIIGSVESVTKCNDHIYAAGFEYDYNNKSFATLWTDGVPEHYVSEWEFTSSHAVEVHSYGDDVYLLTQEYNNDTDKSRTHLWMNGKIIMTYADISPAGFTIF
ncbi:MAG: hypothetical protein IJG42_07775 [Muribaculaceae bacterium]|nr:hypothetical protein [Muribaculaceae bacterium]